MEDDAEVVVDTLADEVVVVVLGFDEDVVVGNLEDDEVVGTWLDVWAEVEALEDDVVVVLGLDEEDGVVVCGRELELPLAEVVEDVATFWLEVVVETLRDDVVIAVLYFDEDGVGDDCGRELGRSRSDVAKDVVVPLVEMTSVVDDPTMGAERIALVMPAAAARLPRMVVARILPGMGVLRLTSVWYERPSLDD